MWAGRGLHKLWQPGSLAARKWRENEKIKRKWRKNEEMEREWGNGENISYIKTCLILSQNVNPVRTGRNGGGHLQIPIFHKAFSPLELEGQISKAAAQGALRRLLHSK